jgi:hypothetical protein
VILLAHFVQDVRGRRYRADRERTLDALSVHVQRMSKEDTEPLAAALRNLVAAILRTVR